MFWDQESETLARPTLEQLQLKRLQDTLQRVAQRVPFYRQRFAEAGVMPEQAEARAALAERVAGIVADLGGPEALSALAIGQVGRHAKLELVDGYLWENLQRHGPLTGKGRTRAVLSAWLQVVDRLQRSAAMLGLARRSRDIMQCSAAEWLDRQAASPPPPGQDGASGTNDTPDGSQ